MAGEAMVYCGSCGGELTESARFCRLCGAAQEPAPAATPAPPPAAFEPAPTPASYDPSPAPTPVPAMPLPPMASVASASSPARTIGALLAIAGGIGACFMVIWAVVYLPLHYHLPVLFGIGVQFGDVLAFGCGAVALTLGIVALARPASISPRTVGALVAVAGLLVLALVLVWAFVENLDSETFQRPFYFGFVYFCELGLAHFGGLESTRFLQVPLLAASLGMLLGGVMIAAARDARPDALGRR